MFAKNKVSQSMLDAVNQVLQEDKKKMITDDQFDETGFHMAAHAAKKANQTHFEFQGKKYPVTAKSHKEAIEMDEASLKIPTATGTKVLGGSGYGSKKAHEIQHKNPFEKGPSKKDLKGVKAPSKKELKSIGEEEMHDDEKEDEALIKKMVKKKALKGEEIKEEGDCVTEPEAKKIAKKEVKGHEKSMHKESFANKLLAHIKENKAMGPTETFTDNNMGEEKKKKNPYAIGMAAAMKSTGDTPPLKKSTIVKAHDIADKIKKEETELDEGDAQYKKNPPRTKMSDVVDRKKTVKSLLKGRQYFGTGKVKEEVEINEKNESHTHAAHYENDKGEWTGMNLFVAKDDEDAIRQAHAKCKEGCRLSRVERHIPVKEDVETTVDKNAHKITTDMLRGRVEGGKLNSFKNFKVNLITSGEESIPKDIEKGEDTREKQKITTNPGPVDIKFDDKLANPTPQSHFSDEKHVTSEEVRGELKKIRNKEEKMHNKEIESFNKKVGHQKEENEILDESRMLDRYLLSKGINPKFISRETKISHSKSGAFKSWLQTHQNESVEPPFDKPYKTSKEPDVTDKSGAKHTPMSRAKDLARQAFKKVKTETMMGKISN